MRLLAFPPCQGRFFDWEQHGLVAALAGRLNQGRLQLFCVDSIDGETWFAEDRPVRDRARRQGQYDQYLRAEVLPFTRHANGHPFLTVAGASIGAYHAVNFAFRHPHEVGRVLSLSGLWDIKWATGGYSDDTVYFHNPCDFIAHEHDPGRLDALRRMDIIFAVGEDEYVRPVAERLSSLLWHKGVGNALRVWRGVTHDWGCWQRMLDRYVDGHD
jgi:esterase/lipase superfamily enzyme